MIRKATDRDIEAIMPVFEKARQFMRREGNMNQWTNGYPSVQTILEDIKAGNFYVDINDNGVIDGGFAFVLGEDPTYRHIDGRWIDDEPYGTIHRLASTGRRGAADRCFEFCRKIIPNLRADTHRDNRTMQQALTRNGFRYCGIIYLADGSPRLAYQRPAGADDARSVAQ